MPEEVNRIVTDAISDLLWTPSPDADENLRAEGKRPERIVRVGNIMIDSYEMLRASIGEDRTAERLGIAGKDYAVVTLHRPVNVDRRDALTALVEGLLKVSRRLAVVFPVHPRTRKQLTTFGLFDRLAEAPGITPIDPLGYISFMGLVRQARCVITDSGGVQEETTYLDIPCLTLRETTERPITVTSGSNRLVKIGELEAMVDRVCAGLWPRSRVPEFWGGRTAMRVVESLRAWLRAG